jgi:hypothetical protein
MFCFKSQQKPSKARSLDSSSDSSLANTNTLSSSSKDPSTSLSSPSVMPWSAIASPSHNANIKDKDKHVKGMLKFARKQFDNAVRITKAPSALSASLSSTSPSSTTATSLSALQLHFDQLHELYSVLLAHVNYASAFTFTGMRNSAIHKIGVRPNATIMFSGPGDSSAESETFLDYASAKVVSTYPLRVSGALRDGVCHSTQSEIDREYQSIREREREREREYVCDCRSVIVTCR